MKLIEELSKLSANEPDWINLRCELNASLTFGSDQVVLEILKFNDEFTKAEKNISPSSDIFQISSETIKPVIIAIRKDLYLKSKSLNDRELRFFQKKI